MISFRNAPPCSASPRRISRFAMLRLAHSRCSSDSLGNVLACKHAAHSRTNLTLLMRAKKSLAEYSYSAKDGITILLIPAVPPCFACNRRSLQDTNISPALYASPTSQYTKECLSFKNACHSYSPAPSVVHLTVCILTFLSTRSLCKCSLPFLSPHLRFSSAIHLTKKKMLQRKYLLIILLSASKCVKYFLLLSSKLVFILPASRAAYPPPGSLSMQTFSSEIPGSLRLKAGKCSDAV